MADEINGAALPSLSTEIPINAPEGSSLEVAGPWIENPSWSGFDLLIVVCVLLLGIFLFTAISIAILHSTAQFHAQAVDEFARNPSVWVVVPAMGAAYLVMFAVLFLLAGTRQVRFWPALSWRWPGSLESVGFLLAGTGLAVAGGLLEKLLPMPKTAPIEEMFLQPGAPQLLAFFGIAVAPLVEETLFRGLLYPVSNRWLRDVLHSQQRIRRGRLIFLLLVPWGFAAHAVSPIGNLLLLATVFVFTGTWFVARSVKQGSTEAARVILPGIVFLAWALVAARLSGPLLERASLALLCVVLLLTILGLKLRPDAGTRLAIALSCLLTAASFTLVHSEQLGGSWGPLLVLLFVSTVLTLTRAYTKSLASSFLIHTGYNTTLFSFMYIATDRFRHLERIMR